MCDRAKNSLTLCEDGKAGVGPKSVNWAGVEGIRGTKCGGTATQESTPGVTMDVQQAKSSCETPTLSLVRLS